MGGELPVERSVSKFFILLDEKGLSSEKPVTRSKQVQ